MPQPIELRVLRGSQLATLDELLQEIDHVVIVLIENAHDELQVFSFPGDKYAKQPECHDGDNPGDAFCNRFHVKFL